MVVTDVEWDKRKHSGEYDLLYVTNNIGGEIARNALAEFGIRTGVNELEYEESNPFNGSNTVTVEADVEIYKERIMVYAEDEAEEYLDSVLSKL